MLFYIILATLSVGAISFIGAIIFLKKSADQKTIKIIISLAAGALLGAVFFTLFPELFGHIRENEGASGHQSSVMMISATILISILIFFMVEKIFHWHHCQCDQPEYSHDKKPMGYINLIGDGIHNFIDGTLIASSFLISPALGISTTLAIIIHEIPQEISDMGILIYSGFSKTKALLWNFISAITAVVGGILAFYLGSTLESLAPFLIAVASGSFLYLAMADIMPELHHEQNKKQLIKQFILLICGAALMYAVSLIGHKH